MHFISENTPWKICMLSTYLKIHLNYSKGNQSSTVIVPTCMYKDISLISEMFSGKFTSLTFQQKVMRKIPWTFVKSIIYAVHTCIGVILPSEICKSGKMYPFFLTNVNLIIIIPVTKNASLHNNLGVNHSNIAIEKCFFYHKGNYFLEKSTPASQFRIKWHPLF